MTLQYSPTYSQESLPREPVTAEKPNVGSLPTTIKGPQEARVIIYNPIVRITRWKAGDTVYGETVGDGVVTGLFSIRLLNIGSSVAKDVSAVWTIRDNGRPIWNPDQWLSSIKRPTWKAEDLQPGQYVEFQYGPHISAAGTGTLELMLAVTYTDSETGEKLRREFRYFTDYVLREPGDSKQFLLSPSSL